MGAPLTSPRCHAKCSLARFKNGVFVPMKISFITPIKTSLPLFFFFKSFRKEKGCKSNVLCVFTMIVSFVFE